MTKYGVAHYEGTAALKVKAPEARPALLPPSAQELPALLPPPAQELRLRSCKRMVLADHCASRLAAAAAAAAAKCGYYRYCGFGLAPGIAYYTYYIVLNIIQYFVL